MTGWSENWESVPGRSDIYLGLAMGGKRKAKVKWKLSGLMAHLSHETADEAISGDIFTSLDIVEMALTRKAL